MSTRNQAAVGVWGSRSRRRAAVTAAAALAGAAGALAGRATTARADITGFAGFAPINSNNGNGATFTTAPNYTSDGVYFNTTDGAGSEAVTGFNTTPQLISSFNAQFTFNASAGADGTAFIIQNQGLTALGGSGGGVGYTGITPSAGLKFNIYNTNSTTFGTGGALTTNNNAIPFTNTTGVPVRVNVSYYGTTLSVTETNISTKQSASQSYTNVNIPAAVNGNTALIGFGSGTGGLTSTQQVGNFRFISNTSYTPIALAGSSFNNDMVVEKGAPQVGATAYITASMDQGTVNLSNNSWYEQGYDAAAPTTGLPASGSTFTSKSDAAHVYQMQAYNGPNALLIGGTGAANNGTMTFTTPQALRALSFLTSSGNGPEGMQLTINYANGTPSSVINDVVSPDWFGQGNLAWNSSGRVVPAAGTIASSFNSVGSANPNLWEADVLLPDTVDPIASVMLTNDTGGGRAAIFALSGASVIGTDTLLYTGRGTPAGSFDTNGSANYTLAGSPAAFVVGDSIIFDDSATGTHAITVQATGVSPTLLTFNNNSSSYTFGGGPINKAAALTMNGTGAVTFNNTTTLTGAATINAGTLTVGGTFTTTGFLVASGATLNVSAGGVVAGSADLADNGTVNVSAPVAVFGSLTGAGAINFTAAGGSTVRATGPNTAYTGSFGGTGGTFNLAAGTYAPPSASALYALTGGLNVGIVNGSAASLVIADNSGQVGTTASGGRLTLTLGPSGTLTSPAGTDATWGGNVVLAAAGGQATITGGNGSTFTLTGPITGVGPVALAPIAGSTLVLNAAGTYTGETRIAATANTQLAGPVVKIGADNGISPASGLAFVNATAAGNGATLDLNGHSQTIAYLNGSAAGNANVTVTTNNGPSVLTIAGGNLASGGPATFAVPIQGNITLVKSGTGNQILSGTNGYAGPTVITGGTLTSLNSGSLGSGQVNLSGGTLSLATVGSTVVGTPQASGFGNFTLTQGGGGGGANVSGGTLNLTDATASESNGGFTTTPVSLARAGFVANFLYSTTGGADGAAFVVQNDPRGTAAIGGAGGQLGVAAGSGGALNGNNAAINNSGAVLFNVYTASTTAFGTNGVLGTFQGANLYSTSAPNPVTIVYDAQAQTVTETVTNGTFGTVNTFAYTGVNFASLLGGSTGYVGFTGATGGITSVQSVSNFTFGAVSAVSTSLSNPIVATAGTSAIQLGAGPSGTTAAIGSLVVNAGATVSVTTSNGSTYHAVLQIPTLSVASTGVVDVTSNDLDLASGGTGNDLTTVTALARAGTNGGRFNGSGGITSSTAATNARHTTTVGVIVNNDGSGNSLFATNAFDGATPGVGDVLVKYTYFGDATLDGVVNGADYTRIDAGYAARNMATPLTGWYNGDFNYDGKVDGSDYTLIDNAFNLQQTSLANATTTPMITASATAEIAGTGAAAVPEPASVGLLVAGGMAVAARRRRRA